MTKEKKPLFTDNFLEELANEINRDSSFKNKEENESEEKEN